MWDNGYGLTFLEIEKKAKKMYKSGKLTYKEYMVIHHRNIKNMERFKIDLQNKVKELKAKKKEQESKPQEVTETPM